MIVKFDGKDVKDSRDLPRIVASTPVGKAVDVVIVRKGQELTKQVTLGRLEDGEKQQQATLQPPPTDTPDGDPPGARPQPVAASPTNCAGASASRTT